MKINKDQALVILESLDKSLREETDVKKYKKILEIYHYLLMNLK